MRVPNLSKAITSSLNASVRAAKRNALADNREFNIDNDYIHRLWSLQDGKCKVSGLEMEIQSGTNKLRNNKKVSIDRIVNTKGYIKGNIQLVRWQVNNAKGADSTESVIELAEAIVRHNKIKI
jgi:hypothetical protein